MAIELKVRMKDGRNPNSTRYYSSKQEKAVAKAIGGNVTANSGATKFQKGDVLTQGENSWILECKTKMVHSDSISIKREWFDKNREEMAFMGKSYQAIVFNFGPGEENHYIIDEFLFKELQKYLSENH